MYKISNIIYFYLFFLLLLSCKHIKNINENIFFYKDNLRLKLFKNGYYERTLLKPNITEKGRYKIDSKLSSIEFIPDKRSKVVSVLSWNFILFNNNELLVRFNKMSPYENHIDGFCTMYDSTYIFSQTKINNIISVDKINYDSYFINFKNDLPLDCKRSSTYEFDQSNFLVSENIFNFRGNDNIMIKEISTGKSIISCNQSNQRPCIKIVDFNHIPRKEINTSLNKNIQGNYLFIGLELK